MAYINQEQKAVIREELKKVLPKSWKWSLSIRHHSSITLTVSKADVDVIAFTNEANKEHAERRGEQFYEVKGNVDINTFHFAKHYEKHPEFVAILEKAVKAIKSAGWYDRSDIQTDYFDTAYYFDIQFGKWDKPFELVAK